MLIFISIFILVSLRDSVEIWTRNEIEGNRSSIENRSKRASAFRKSEIWSFEKYARKKERKFIYLFFKSRKIKGTRILDRATKISNLRIWTKFYDNHSRRERERERDYLHSCLNVKYSVRWRHSWLPLRRNSVVGWHSLSAHRYNTHCNKAETKKKNVNHIKLEISSRIKRKKAIYNFFLYASLQFGLEMKYAKSSERGVKFVSHGRSGRPIA